MRSDLALETHENPWVSNLLAGLREALESHTGLLDQVIEQFPKDYARVADMADVLFGPDVLDYSERAARIFTEWDTGDGGPSLPALQAYAIEHFNLPTDSIAARAAMLAAVLAEIRNDLPYHGNTHYRKVMFHTIRLMASQIEGNFPYQPLLYSDDLMKLLVAAAIHDLGHEGGDNMRDGIYKPGYMEQKSFDYAQPYFDAINLDKDFARDVETLIFCTDITFIAGDNSPCIRMKKIYKHFFLGGLGEGDEMGNMLLGKMRRFEDNPRLSIMAMLLHEADVATSAGLTYEQSKVETIKLMGERGLKNPGPKMLLKFLNEQLCGSMTTPAAQQIFGAQMDAITRQASADLQAGIETF